MRQQIAAANWKMNLTYAQAEDLLNDLLLSPHSLKPHQSVVLAVPFPYLSLAKHKVDGKAGFFVAAQNCYTKNRVLIPVKLRRDVAVNGYRICNPRSFGTARIF